MDVDPGKVGAAGLVDGPGKSESEAWDPTVPLLDTLPDLDRMTVQAIALCHEPVTRTAVHKILTRAGLRNGRGRQMSAGEVEGVLQGLARKGFLQSRMGDRGYALFEVPGPLAWPAAQWAISTGRFQSLAPAIREALPPLTPHSWGIQHLASYEKGMREVFNGLLANDARHVEHFLKLVVNTHPDIYEADAPLSAFCLEPFRPQWFRSRSLELQSLILTEVFDVILLEMGPVNDLLPLLWDYRVFPEGKFGPLFRHLLIVFLIMANRFDDAETVLTGPLPVSAPLCLKGWLAFLSSDNDRAIAHFQEALKSLRRQGSKRKIFFKHVSSPFFILALLKSGTPVHRREALSHLRIALGGADPYRPLNQGLFGVAMAQDGRVAQAVSWLRSGQLGPSEKRISPPKYAGVAVGPAIEDLEDAPLLGQFFQILCLHWVDPNLARSFREPLREIQSWANAVGFDWVTAETRALLDRLEAGEGAEEGAAGEREERFSLVGLFRTQEPWERALESLAAFALAKSDQGGACAAQGPEKRLAWLISPPRQGRCRVQPKEQRLQANGGWSKGRVVSLERLHHSPEDLSYLLPQDLRVCATIRGGYNHYGRSTFEFDPERALLALVGHPSVFWLDKPLINVELVKGEPELIIKESRGALDIRFNREASQPGVHVIRETPTRCQVVEITDQHREMAEILGPNGLKAPAREKQRVLELLPALSTMVTLQSAIGGVGEHLPEVAADSRPHLHLLPFGEGLKMKAMIRPFGNDGPYLVPGHGANTLITDVGGKRVQTTRDLAAERRKVREVLKQCPSLAGEGTRDWEWTFPDPEQSLELLLELRELDDQAVVSWPEGARFQVSRPLTPGDLSLRFVRQRDWFGVEGDVQVDPELTLELQRLLKLMAGGQGRFIPLGEGQFVALTRTLQKRLEELRDFSSEAGGGRRLHPLALPALETLTDEAGSVSGDRAWKSQLARFHKARDHVTEIPSTFQAQLRDYQMEGVQWLGRLAAWGVGACLADDMGLGKTIQALALLLSRAPAGPALVVAPTSVCLNWRAETLRWAPTLNVRMFGEGDRDQALADQKPFDLLICSYGLLQVESERLAAIPWGSIVLDEAQAIKNRATKRSKAAMALQGDFRMVATGTPIENHLGELWNVFRFLNPGLLGSLEQFNRRFAIPIERDQDSLARRRLKNLIQPFLLRRTKSRVLEELPSRTEITLNVTLSPEEQALYEAMRREAVKALEAEAAQEAPNHLQVLAEITRLRRACCHPNLVAPEAKMAGSKLTVFGKVVEELLENGHKALVFSQFVDHLAIIRDFVDKRKIAYQYLDGRTPARKRQERVSAFQAGEGDLFLISLKAGGTGLNLTAADYVIHMDPWWNPAVEDQASDRVHRIGQTRPVTIYRLVTVGAIEEKIVNLHREKRDLADSLLEGGDVAGRMSVEALMGLIREGG